MNVHHLELFYYVARHGGIMPAVRNIPYGIQQPAVSSQVAQLEEFLGTTLFQRRPFKLTETGERLFQFIQPFFSNLDKVADELQGGQARQIRVGASTIILREHLPDLFQAVKKKFPRLKMSLREGYPAQLEELLLKDEIDLAVTLLERKPSAGIHSLALLELPLVLLVEKGNPLKSAKELWQQDKIDEALICLPQSETICRDFQKKLGELGVDWFPSIEASSWDLIEAYVSAGLGIGMSLAVPGYPLPANVKALPLNGFPKFVIGALWHGRKTPLIELFLAEGQKRAERFV
ncbi:MAG TPA: LysR family transcriptional regulator [Verrucomicrobiae bacterium]|nr:LysR family transcriptional regulator [Verrucomicrobiae bacterium]